MNFDEAHTAESLPSVATPEVLAAPKKPVDEIAAERKAEMAQVQTEFGEAMSKDQRCTEIGDTLYELSLTEEGAILMPFVEGDAFPDATNECLYQYEAGKRTEKVDYDVTTQSPKRLVRILERGLEKHVTRDTKSEVLNQEDQFSALRDSLKGQPNTTIIEAMLDPANADIIPEVERTKWEALSVLIGMADTPEDQAIIKSKVNALDGGSNLPNMALFIETEILADETLSESYRDEVAARFKIPNPRIKTGGQVDDSLNPRAADGGPLYTAKNPLDLGHGSAAYENPDGSRAVRVSVPGRGDREISWQSNDSDDVIGTKISLAKIWAQNEWGGQTDFFGEGINIETHILSQTDPGKLRKVQNVMNALFGGTRGFDAVIVQDNEAEFLGWFNQFTATKGDAMQRDFDKDVAVENRTNLGLHPNGDPQQIDYDVLREAAKYAKGQFGSGEPNYFALQKHLHQLYPERVPLAGDNEEADEI